MNPDHKMRARPTCKSGIGLWCMAAQLVNFETMGTAKKILPAITSDVVAMRLGEMPACRAIASPASGTVLRFRSDQNIFKRCQSEEGEIDERVGC